MRSDQSLSNIIDAYRRVSVSVGGLVAALLLLIVAAIALLPSSEARPLQMLVVAAGLGVVVLIILRLGYRAMRLRIEQADTEKRAGLASAHRDALTGVMTRSHFLENLKRSVYHGSSASVGYMQVDMDNLKIINDLNGHSAGDAALVHLIDMVTRLMPGAFVGRLGGDEFGIAIVGHDNKLALKRLGDTLLAQLSEPTLIGGRRLRLSATVGVAMSPQDTTDCNELISKADLALYKGKRNGRACVVAFEEDMLGDERHRRFVERELRAAILMNELELYYQPVFAADGVTLRSYEALVRWQHRVRGTISPVQFVPVAEQSDLIDKLGDWVLRRACLDLAALGTASVAINVSAAQLRRPDFAQRFATIVAQTGADPHQLIVEITETVPLLSSGTEMDNLSQVRATGVRVAIDDFGAGHASLQYLRAFTFDIIKIDRTYVSSIASNRMDAMIVAAICEIARSLPVEVIAEGVEEHEQLALLQAAGCTGFQGYLLGRPQPIRLWQTQPGGAVAAAA
ncbi:GGDEF and EAL domain-containing protein [Devosia sp.]|uniref:putative bifunctional diguanylate cyclase/phosphodiesterase n=1 Tax=Devosia sp. TaxID=1871048 RepID=UPI003264B5DE